ncbi:hypothetical protein PYW08_000831 [Mythimna loreyi]|uniref:Uncharacterized protein n=1 Tax=Mythimna loreyi TaxID=667449 RepID=A0ACC2QZM7_9NEOP|nr:hypothetical protein PYW08_000831 [Mythimna loreyi]
MVGLQPVFQLKNKDFGPKVVGGQAVSLEKYPFAVQFFNYGSLCGGVILNSWSVLTSGHCFESNQDTDEMRVQIGSKYIYDFSAKKHKISYFVVHENYNRKIPFENDIGILFVKEQIKFSNVAKKGILVDHDKWMNPKEKRFIVTGWGMLEYNGALSDMSLMMTSLAFVPLKTCSRLHDVTLSADMFCLYGDGKRDTCKGDSGGGVLWKGRLVGLTSHGDGCAKEGKPSVYTNLYYQTGWIKKQVAKFIEWTCKNKNKGQSGAGNVVTLNFNT